MYKLYRLLVIGVCTVILVVACTRSPNSSISKPVTSASSESCRLVEHEGGETEICGQPKTVVAFSPRALDVMLALDIQPAAYAEAAYTDRKVLDLDRFDNPSQQIPHLGDRITTQPINLGHRNTPSLETLVEVKPDLIVAETWQEKGFLSQIAPTLLLNNQSDKEGWIRRLQIVAQAFGKEAQLQQVIAQYEQKLAQVRTKLAPVVDTYPNVLPVEDYKGSGFWSGYTSNLAVLLREMGFKLASLDDSPQTTDNLDADTKISIEAIAKSEPDIIMVLVTDLADLANPDPEINLKWSENPLLQNIPAVKEGRILFVDTQLWGGTRDGPIAYNLMLDRLPDLMLPFVEKQ